MRPDSAHELPVRPDATIPPPFGRDASRVLVIVTVVLLGYLVVRSVHAQRHGPRADWGVFHAAGANFAAGRPIYEADALMPYKYAPVVAMSFAWMSAVPVQVARCVWAIGDVLGLAGFLWLVGAIVDGGRPRCRRELVAVGCLSVLLLTNNLLDHFHSGQVTIALLLLVTLAYFLLERERPVLSGSVLAVAICVKVVPIVFVPMYLLRRRGWRGIAGTGAGLVGLCLLPAVWTGWEGNLEQLAAWPRQLLETNNRDQPFRPQNLSVFAVLNRLLGGHGVGGGIAVWSDRAIWRLWFGASAVYAAAVYLFGWRSSRERISSASVDSSQPAYQRRTAPDALASATVLCLLLLFVTAFNPHAWRYNFLALAAPLYVVLLTWSRSPERNWWLPCLVGLAIALNNIPTRPESPLLVALLRDYGGRLLGVALLAWTLLSVRRLPRTATDGHGHGGRRAECRDVLATRRLSAT